HHPPIHTNEHKGASYSVWFGGSFNPKPAISFREFRGYPHQLEKARRRSQNESNNQEPRFRTQPAIKQPTKQQTRDDSSKKRESSRIGHARFAIGFFLIFFRHANFDSISHCRLTP